MVNEKKYACIYLMRGMMRNHVYAENPAKLHELLGIRRIVIEENSIEGLSEQEIIDKIYEDASHTTAHVGVYKLDENFDPETADEFDDEYIICKKSK